MVLIDILTNKILISCLVSLIITQILKVVVDSIKKGRYDTSSLLSTGGMPSSHAAIFSALTAAVYIETGASTMFAVVLVITIRVMYDALTIRNTVGHHTAVLNDISKVLKLHRKFPPRELKGHSFLQLTAGIAVGILLTLIVYHV